MELQWLAGFIPWPKPEPGPRLPTPPAPVAPSPQPAIVPNSADIAAIAGADKFVQTITQGA